MFRAFWAVRNVSSFRPESRQHRKSSCQVSASQFTSADAGLTAIRYSPAGSSDAHAPEAIALHAGIVRWYAALVRRRVDSHDSDSPVHQLLLFPSPDTQTQHLKTPE